MPDFQRLPLFPLNTVLFPGLTLPLRIFEPRYRQMLMRCLESRSPFGIVMIRNGSEVGDGSTILSSVGTTARVTKCERSSDDSYLIEVEGETRFVINETFDSEPYLTAKVTPFWEQAAEPLEMQPLYDQTVTLFKGYLISRLAIEKRHLANLQMPRDPVLMSFAVAASLQTTMDEKQSLLEIAATTERLQQEIDILRREKSRADVDSIDESATNSEEAFVPLDTEEIISKMSRN